jgi:hexokinase
MLFLCFTFKYSIRQVVNMEWGNFWSSHLPRTPYDISLDDETQNRNDQVTLSVKYLLQYLYPWLVSMAEQIFH